MALSLEQCATLSALLFRVPGPECCIILVSIVSVFCREAPRFPGDNLGQDATQNE